MIVLVNEDPLLQELSDLSSISPGATARNLELTNSNRLLAQFRSL